MPNQPNRPQQPSTTLIVCLTIIIVCGFAFVYLLISTVEESTLPEGWLMTASGLVVLAITTFAALAKLDKIDSRMDATARQVDDLYNGRGDSKSRAAVADVLRDEHIDPAMLDQIEADRARRDAH